MWKRISMLLIGAAVFAGCQAKQAAPEPEPTVEKASPFPAAQARLTRTYTCPAQVTGYDPTAPSKILGYFKPGSVLKMGDQVTPAGMVLVTYQDPGGPLITAYCYATDVGLGPPGAQPQAQPQATPPPEKPKGLSGSRPTDGNSRYKPMGGGF